ncbi:hypothetical protein SDC9_204646 [bioreactor metagenome]|uniref:Uncharacterized protein n=1 Tax=bioreactor metagenome TaxID=1076179 RepID=A0A645JBN9_9ZZZZ
MPGRLVGQAPIAGQRLGGQEAANDEEGLNGDPRMLGEPGEQAGRKRSGVIGHRPVEGEMMQNDQLRGDGLDRVDEMKALRHAAGSVHAER